MKRIRLAAKIGLLAWILIMFSGVAWGISYEKQIDELLKRPAISYEKPYTLETTEAIWVKVLDNPLLIGGIWKAYGFQPAYQVTPTPSGIHVVDPSGIVGDVFPVESAGTSRRFYGHGFINHWVIPSFFSAHGIIHFQYQVEQHLIRVQVKVFMRGNNAVSNLVIRAFSGILINRVDSRISNHIRDMKTIADDITHHPEKTQQRLSGQPLSEFNRIFMMKAQAP
jgi:hypothetical protein